jgi:hypothetical protein
MHAPNRIGIEGAINPVANVRNVGKASIDVVATSRKWFEPLCKSLWPAKTASSLHYLTGAPERTCYDWKTGKVDPPARAIISILQSDQGWRFLALLMRGSSKHWWTETVKARDLSHSDDKDQLELFR